MDDTLHQLDSMILNLGGANISTQSPGPSGLLLEHLRVARTSLLGGMRGEYDLSLEQAKDSIACISGETLRTEVKKTLQGLIDSQASQAPVRRTLHRQ
jgi:hypothetical protein